MTLEQIWNELKGRVAQKTEIPVWAPDKGYLGEWFIVVGVRPDHVQVAEPGAENVQRIPDADFVAVLGLWGDYADGKLPASAIAKKTRFPKYVTGILRALEQPPPQ